MHARSLVAAAAILALSCGLAAARDLTVVARGARVQDAIKEVFVRPFTAATDDPGADGELGGRHRRAADPGEGAGQHLGPGAWWTATNSPPAAPRACSRSSTGRRSAARTTTCRRRSAIAASAPASPASCWPGTATSFPRTPGWADFWDVAKYPGKRGLHRGVRGNLEFALIADGVSPGDVYKVLATSEGVDRAFRKLDQLKPYIVWWQDDAEAARILASGDVLMTSASAPAIAAVEPRPSTATSACSGRPASTRCRAGRS